MMDLFNTPAAGFDQPTAMLRACHGKVQRFCSQLDRLAGYLKEHGCNEVVLQSVAQIRHYFNVAAPLHHQDEEEDFFPLLAHHAPESAAVIAALEAEHGELHALWRTLDAHLAALPGQPEADEALIARFTAAYARHIPQEEALFDLGESVIPADDLARIGRNMAARRQPPDV